VEAFSKLTGGVAHDFNNMLSVIIGYSQIMQEDFESDDENRLFLSEIEKAAIRASSLTNQLLAFSKPPEIKRSILQVNDVLVEISKMLRRLLGDQIELVVEPSAILPMVQVDRSQIEQAFINLAVGARGTMGNGGKILISTKSFTLRKALLRDGRSLTPGTYAHICFTQFPNTPEASSSNTGSGTALSVIEQNDGRLFMRQMKTGDSRIDIYFPAYQESLAPDAPPSTKKQQRKSVVLLVEDDSAMRRFARTVLQRIGHTVLSACNGEEALKVLDENPKVKPDLLLSDMVMPRMGGLALAEKITKKFPNISILLVSGDPEQQPIAHQSPFDFSFLRKPFATGDLISKVGSLLQP
jgi:CheY-like chemotaxis protein